MLPREPGMRIEDPELPPQRSRGSARPIQTALTDRDRATFSEQRVEALEGWRILDLGELGQQLGVDAERDLEARIAPGKLLQCAPGVRSDGRNEDALHSGGPGAVEHRLAIRVEARDVQMAVGVDQPAGPRPGKTDPRPSGRY